jgi:hypothetical protein
MGQTRRSVPTNIDITDGRGEPMCSPHLSEL